MTENRIDIKMFTEKIVMTKYSLKLLYLLISAVLFSCQKVSKSSESKLTTIKEINSTPTVDIENYNLVLNAEEILRLKRN